MTTGLHTETLNLSAATTHNTDIANTETYASEPLTPEALRHTLGAYPTGVALIVAEDGGETIGMLANSFGSVSLEPPLVQMSFDHSSTTWPRLKEMKEVGISILSAANKEHALQLRGPTARRFAGLHLEKNLNTSSTARFLPGSAAQFTVRPCQDIDAGDHTIRIFHVITHTRNEHAAPLVFHSGLFTTTEIATAEREN